MRVPTDKVPIDVRRRAARMLHSLVEFATEKDRDRLLAATFGDEATPIHRPDIDDIAYWELEITGVTTLFPLEEGEADTYDRGFILVATGPHDVPIPHFSLDLAPPSRRLEKYGDPARIVKLDSLCYVAEDDRGTMLGRIGTVPPKLAGLPDVLPKRLPQGYSVSVPVEGTSDEKPVTSKPRISREKRIEVGAWRSWEELKSSYATTYRHHLAALATRAEHPWRIEELTEKYGQGIREGESIEVILLERADVKVDGPGADFVKVSLNPQPLPPRVRLTALHPKEADTTVVLTTSYGETLTFFVLPADAPTRVVPKDSPLGVTMTGVLR